MENKSSEDIQGALEESIKTAVETATKSLDLTSKALTEGVKSLNDASERFAERSPGQRASWLGFLLVLLAILLGYSI